MQINSKQPSGFAKYLVEQNLMEYTIIKELITPTLNNNETLITKLIANNSLDGTDLARAIADYFSIPFIDLKQLQHSQLSLDLLQPQLIQKYRVLPLAKTNDQLQLALADPTNSAILNTIRFHTALNINPVVVAYDQLAQVIEKVLPAKKYNPLADEDAPIIKFIDQILNDAIIKHASDIHFEPYEECCRIRFRVDGLLYEITKTESLFGPRFSARLKIMANLDIAEKRLPQDGRFTLKLATNQNQDCRLSVCPTMFGEKLVVRILNPINISLIALP
ncbi:hypothetical protein GAMM_160101 [Gammaproteobacteria bacterium]